MITLPQLNDPAVREKLSEADVVVFVDPASGRRTFVSGRASLEAIVL